MDGGSSASYAYDADGRRIRKNSGGGWTEYFYDVPGSVAAEKNTSAWTVEYVYVNGKLVTQYRDNTTYFIHSDHLGSTRLLTKLDQSVYDSMDYLPFGEQILGTTGTTHKFTSKERDAETGLDYFGARYYANTTGRFLSPDWSANPAPVPYAELPYPQSLNLYSYVQNNPLGRIDADGHDEKDLTSRKKEPEKDIVAAEQKKDSNDSSVLHTIGQAWLTATSPVQNVADWVDEHPLIVFPVAIAAALKGTEGPIEADEEVLAKEGATLLESMQAHGRTILMAVEGSPEGEEALRYLETMQAEANAGGPGQMHIILRPDATKATVLEEFLHGTQSRLGIIDRLGVAGAEKHVADFMQRHKNLLGLE